MFEEDKLIAFVDGFVTDEADLTDEMYEKADMHNESGAWPHRVAFKLKRGTRWTQKPNCRYLQGYIIVQACKKVKCK